MEVNIMKKQQMLRFHCVPTKRMNYCKVNRYLTLLTLNYTPTKKGGPQFGIV